MARSVRRKETRQQAADEKPRPSAEAIAVMLVRDVQESLPEADYRAGFIGEIAVLRNVEDFYDKISFFRRWKCIRLLKGK